MGNLRYYYLKILAIMPFEIFPTKKSRPPIKTKNKISNAKNLFS